MKRTIIFLMVTFFLAGAAFSQSNPHVYLFNNTLNEAMGNGPSLTENLTTACSPLPAAGTYVSDNICSPNSTVFAFNQYAGLNYPNPGFVSNNYTIHLYWKFSTYGPGYARLIDFRNSTSDRGIYILFHRLHFYSSPNYTAPNSFVDGNYYLLSLVRDGASNMIDVYIDGVFLTTYDDASNNFQLPSNTTPLIFFRDNDGSFGCEAQEGKVKYISISNTISTEAQVAAVYANICNPPSVPLSNWALYLGIFLMVMFTAIRFRKMV